MTSVKCAFLFNLYHECDTVKPDCYFRALHGATNSLTDAASCVVLYEPIERDVRPRPRLSVRFSRFETRSFCQESRLRCRRLSVSLREP